MRTALVSFYEAFPPASGAASVTCGFAKGMPGTRLLVQVASRCGRCVCPDGIQVITLAGHTRRLAKLMTLHRRLRHIVECCRDFRPDLVVLEGASWVLYHWLLLRRLRRELPDARIAYHAHNIEAVLRAKTTAPFVRRITRWAERSLFREADHATVASAVDRDQVASLYGTIPEVLPNGIDLDRILRVTDAQVETVRRKFGLTGDLLLFMGMYAYPPNRDAIDFLVSSVMPRVLAHRPHARLVVLGGRVPHSRPWLKNPGLVDADEVPAVVRACSVGTAPIFSGSGTRLKILEYAAASLPVVATRKGAEGLSFTDGSEILLGEDADSFARLVVRVLSDEGLARSVGAAGRIRAHSDYAWPTLIERFLDAIGAVEVPR